MTKYYKTYNDARLKAKASDMILLNWYKGYYLFKSSD